MTKIALLMALSVFLAPGQEALGLGEGEDPFPALPEAITSPLPEFGLVFSPAGDEVYFARMSSAWGTADSRSTLYTARKRPDGWSEAEAVFDDGFNDGDPALSPDGQRLYFTTNRSTSGEAKSDNDIWVANRVENGWGNLRPVPGLNSETAEFSPTLTEDGRIYFASLRAGGLGLGDIWMADPVGEGFSQPVHVGAPVSTPGGEWNVLVAPDERFLIVEASGREDALSPRGDMYAHYREGNRWEDPQPLEVVNTLGSDLMPRLSADGRHVFYTSSGTHYGRDTDIFQINLDEFLAAAAPASRELLLVVSRSAHELVALDPRRLEILARYKTGLGPHELAVQDTRDWIFTPNYGIYPRPHAEPILPSNMQFTSEPSDTLTRHRLDGLESDATTFRICSRSHGVTITPDGHVWVTCENDGRVLELDAETGERIKEWPIGVNGSHQLAATADNDHVITTNVEAGSVSIIDRRGGSVTTIPTQTGAEGLALSPDQRQAWVGNTQDNSISIIDIESKSLIDTFASEGRFPVKLVFTPDGTEVWVVNTFSREITIFDVQTRQKTGELEFDSPPLGINISKDGAYVYVSFPRLNQVRMIERAARREIKQTDGVMEADGIGWITVPR